MRSRLIRFYASLLCLAAVANAATQSNAPWGLDRIDQRGPGLSGTYMYNYDGSGVIIYIVDSGVEPQSVELGDRLIATRHYVTAASARYGSDDWTKSPHPSPCAWHGTRVATVAAGRKYGVAKGAALISIRVTRCECPPEQPCQEKGVEGEDLMNALKGIAATHPDGVRGVVNLSLALPSNAAYASEVEQAVKDLVMEGFVVVASATDPSVQENPDGSISQNGQPCVGSIPAKLGEGIANGIITVSGIDREDRRAIDPVGTPNRRMAGTGSCVDLFAPSGNLALDFDGRMVTFPYTSSAAPLVAGAAALVWQQYPTLTPALVEKRLYDHATTDRLYGVPADTRNALLYTLLPVTDCAAPPATVKAPATLSASKTGTATVTATSGATYYWTVENGMLWGGRQSSQMQYIAGCSGTTTVRVTVTSNCGMQSHGSATSTILPPQLQLWGGGTIAPGETATVYGGFSGTYPWQVTWSDGVKTTSIITSTYAHEVTPVTTTRYTATFKDKHGCTGPVSEYFGPVIVTVE